MVAWVLLPVLLGMALLCLLCAVFVYVHAFQRSVGTGFMVLCIPCYIYYYAFSQFEHPRKNFIVAGLCASAGLMVILNLAIQLSAMPRPS